jgi:hypothetical protein
MIQYSKNRNDWIFQFAETRKINYCVVCVGSAGLRGYKGYSCTGPGLEGARIQAKCNTNCTQKHRF